MFAEKFIDIAGKELFMIDHSLDDSDVKFLEEGCTCCFSFVRTVIIFHTELTVVGSSVS